MRKRTVSRKGYSALLHLLRSVITALNKADESCGFQCNDPMIVMADALVDALDVHEKCRVVIDYDPADERVRIRKELCTTSEA